MTNRMTPDSSPQSLVDLAEIARRFQVKKDTVNKWRHRGIFPPADFDLSVGPIWWWITVAKWGATTGRLPLNQALVADD